MLGTAMSLIMHFGRRRIRSHALRQQSDNDTGAKFRFDFVGPKNIYLDAADKRSLSSGWVRKGTWDKVMLGPRGLPSKRE